jgi:transcriptional regulator with XRE-family HTH domain
MSLERLADSLGVTYQQVQKYEVGMNRVGASRLFDISRVLDVQIGFFFDDQSDGPLAERRRTRATDSPDPLGDTNANRRQAVELVQAFNRIVAPLQRRLIIDLIKSMGSPDHASDLSFLNVAAVAGADLNRPIPCAMGLDSQTHMRTRTCRPQG